MKVQQLQNTCSFQLLELSFAQLELPWHSVCMCAGNVHLALAIRGATHLHAVEQKGRATLCAPDC